MKQWRGNRVQMLHKSLRIRLASVLSCSLVGALAACQAAAPPQPLTPAQSAALKPADAHLAELYDHSCRSCHTVADSGAPLAGDRTKWDPRWAKGEAVLLASAVQGLNGMPAGGQCFSCTPDDYRGLIRFMAGREK